MDKDKQKQALYLTFQGNYLTIYQKILMLLLIISNILSLIFQIILKALTQST